MQKIPEGKDQIKPGEQKEKRPEPERKIIKFDTPEKPPQELAKKPTTEKVENNPPPTKILSDKGQATSADAAREELEQRRAMLQNMKDFDFQIKKNQEDITHLSEKIENLSKDLDDLVSLYEIVSEQMNPFVGLSKVTKKRLDALENFTKEVENVKTRIGDLESMLEKNGINVTANNSQVKTKPLVEMNTKQEVPSPPKAVIPNPIETPAIPTPSMEKITDQEIDTLLNKSLESLLFEQNIDTMITEFLISLK